MALVGKGCYFGDHPSVGFRRHRASPDHVHVIGPVKIAHARLNVSFQQYHSTSSFVRPADCSLPTRYLLYHIAATNGPHRAIIE